MCVLATCSNRCFKSTVIVISESCSPVGGQYVKSLVLASEFPGKLEQMFSTRVPQKAAKKKPRLVCSGQPTSYLKGSKPPLEIHCSKVLKSTEILQKHHASGSTAASHPCQGQRVQILRGTLHVQLALNPRSQAAGVLSEGNSAQNDKIKV